MSLRQLARLRLVPQRNFFGNNFFSWLVAAELVGGRILPALGR